VARCGDGATVVGSASTDTSSQLRPPAREGRPRVGDGAHCFDGRASEAVARRSAQREGGGTARPTGRGRRRLDWDGRNDRRGLD
jgi:hypothetical protein